MEQRVADAEKRDLRNIPKWRTRINSISQSEENLAGVSKEKLVGIQETWISHEL